MVSADFFRDCSDEQPYVMPLAFDFEIGFIAGVDVIGIAFVFEIEAMAIVSDSLNIV